MKLIIAGSRTLTIENPCNFLRDIIVATTWPQPITEFVHGGCPTGPDSWVQGMSELFEYNKYNNIRVFPAEWNKHGKKAGPLRNKEMAEYADALLLIWDGKSAGSKSMKKEMEKLGKLVIEIQIGGENLSKYPAHMT